MEQETDKGKFTVLIEFRNIFPHIYLYVIAGPNDGTQLADFLGEKLFPWWDIKIDLFQSFLNLGIFVVFNFDFYIAFTNFQFILETTVNHFLSCHFSW